jgi:hypothetical protein
MADYNSSALLGGGFNFNNYMTNPLTLAGLQMLSNNSPRIGQIPNTFSGVAEIVGNAAAAQRKQQEAAEGKAAISAALQNVGFSKSEADMYANNPEAAKIVLGEKKRRDELQQQNDAWEQYKALDQPQTPPPAAFDQPDVWDSVPNPLDKDQSRFNQSAAEPQAELADQLASMGQKYTGAPLNQVIPEMANGNKTVAARMLSAAKALGISPDTPLTEEMLNDPETAIPLLRAAGIGTEGELAQAHAAAVDAAAQRKAALAEQYAALPTDTATDAGAQRRVATAASYSESAEEPIDLEKESEQQQQQQPQFAQAEPSLGAALAKVAQLQSGQGGQAQPDWMAGAQAQPMTAAPRQAAPAPQTRTEQALEARRDQELQNQIRKQQFLIARPGIPAGMKEAAKLELQHLYKQIEGTDADIRKYEYARRQLKPGEEMPPFTDWLRANKAPVVQIDQKGEGAESIARGKAAGERAGKAIDAAEKSGQSLLKSAHLEQLLSRVAQGKLEPARMSVSAWAKAFGLDDDAAKKLGLKPDDVGDQQAISALTNEMIVGKIGPGGFPANNFSDADREFLTQVFPQLSNEPKANKIIIEASRRIDRLNIEYAKEWTKYRKAEKAAGREASFDDFAIDYADKLSEKDVFGDLIKQAESLGASSSTPAFDETRGSAPIMWERGPDGRPRPKTR